GVFLLLCGLTPVAAEEQTATERAREILRQVDDMWRGISSHAIFTMQVKTTHYTRSMRMEAWSKGKEQTLVRILSPLKEKGTATLKSENNIYSYLPRTDRTIRLTSGMMMGSWMGSHFTNDDLVKESRMEDDYEPTISFEGMRDGQDIIIFSLIPKPDAPVVWGKIEITVLAEGFIPLQQIYYDEDMAIARTMRFSDVKPMAGRLRPAVMRIVPSDKPDEYTELDYKLLELDVKLSDHFFSIARLRRK
ncbi:MAG: outer membrane lipoprotein-sorting protein, partial [Gammaproteobacteria bacterium]|nr:outer membrane lipoprotein-sorting protein [Gammaproteobacteria bacterium]